MLRVALMMLMAGTAQAQSFAGSQGLSLQLMCQTYTMVSGNLGLFIGFLIALTGLWALIAKASYKGGLILIIIGALFTALPGLILSVLKGANVWMRESGMTQEEVELDVLLDGVVAYAGRCNQISVNMADYEKYARTNSSFNPIAAFNSRGSPDSPIDLTNQPQQNSSLKGKTARQLPCIGQVIDIESAPNASISSPFGMRSAGMHKGLDIAAPNGTPILALKSGTVIASMNKAANGEYVAIDHGGGDVTLYLHMSLRNAYVGDQVAAGDIIGLVGNTGRSRGANGGYHLHLAVKKFDKYLDPYLSLSCGG